MRYTKTIVCLANSRKPPSGRCIAGREVLGAEFGNWIRPVSDRTTEEIALEERRYQDGRDPKVLDIISIEMKSPKPHQHQQENHLIDADWYWTKNNRMSWMDLQPAVEDSGAKLWMNGHSSSHGQDDRVPEIAVGGFSRSLYLIRPDDLRLVVAMEGSGNYGPPRRRVRARFSLCGHSYCFVVTDPIVEEFLLAKDDGEMALSEALLCVSLSEVFNGFAYKLAAAVITPNREGA